MKYFLIVILLVLQMEIVPQTKILDSFMNIKWGSSISSVLKKMSQKENVKVLTKTDTLVIMSGGNFGARDVLSWRFSFWNNMFYSVTLFIKVPTPIFLEDMFLDLKKDISEKYGKPNASDSVDEFDQKVLWEFPKQNKSKDECFIFLTINSDPFFWIVLAYQNESILEKKIEYEKIEREKALKEL